MGVLCGYFRPMPSSSEEEEEEEEDNDVEVKSARGVWGLGHVFDGKLCFTRDMCEEKWIPKDLVHPKKLVAAPSCLHQWRVPQFALKYPCNLPPHPLADCPGVTAKFCFRALGARGFQLVFWECPPNLPREIQGLPPNFPQPN